MLKRHPGTKLFRITTMASWKRKSRANLDFKTKNCHHSSANVPLINEQHHTLSFHQSLPLHQLKNSFWNNTTYLHFHSGEQRQGCIDSNMNTTQNSIAFRKGKKKNFKEEGSSFLKYLFKDLWEIVIISLSNPLKLTVSPDSVMSDRSNIRSNVSLLKERKKKKNSSWHHQSNNINV